MGNKLQKDSTFKHQGAQPKPVNMKKSPFITKQHFGYKEDDYVQRKIDTNDKMYGHLIKLRLDAQTNSVRNRLSVFNKK